MIPPLLTEIPLSRIFSSSGLGAAVYAVFAEIYSLSTRSRIDSVKSIMPSWAELRITELSSWSRPSAMSFRWMPAKQ